MNITPTKKTVAFLLICLWFVVIRLSVFANDDKSSRDRVFEIYGRLPVNAVYVNYLNQLLPQYNDDYLVEVIEKIDHRLNVQPHIYLLQMLKADALTKLYDEYKGVAYLTEQIEKYPRHAMYYLLRGVFLYNHHFFRSSTDDLAQAVAIDPSIASAHYHLHYNYILEDKIHLSIAALQKAVEYDSKNDVYYYYLGQLLLNDHKVVEGTEALQKAVELAPNNEEYVHHLGEVFMRTNESQSALDFFEEKIRKKPQDKWLVNNYILYLIYLNKIDTAFRFVQTQLKKYPHSAIYFYNQGQLYQYEKKYKEALASLLKSLKRDPKLLRAKLQLYRVYWVLEQYDQAETVLEELNDLQVRDVAVYIYLARLYNYQNRVYSAEDVILNGLKYDPENEHLLYEYSQVLFKRKRFKESISILKGLSEQFPKNTAYIGELGIMYYKTNDMASAEKYLKQVVTGSSDLYRYYIADVFYQKKNLKALYDLAKVDFKDKQVLATIYYKIANLENDLSQPKKALGSINKALVLNPNNQVFLIMESEIFANLKQPKAALNSLNKVLFNNTSRLIESMEVRMLMALKDDQSALKGLKAYNDYHRPELYMILAEDYLTGHTFFKNSKYRTPGFTGLYDTLMRNASYADTLKQIKKAPNVYRRILLEIFFSKFYVNNEKAERLLLETGVKSKHKKSPEPLSKEELFVEIFRTYRKDQFDKEALVSKTDSYEQAFGKNLFVTEIKSEVLIDLEKFDEAVKELTWIKNNYPENEWALVKLAFAYDYFKKHREAQQIYLSLLRKHPESPLLLNNLAWLYITTKEPGLKKADDALDYVNRAIAADPRPEYLDTKAEILYQKGEFKEALSLIEKALVSDNSDADHFKKQRRKILNALKSNL